MRTRIGTKTKRKKKLSNLSAESPRRERSGQGSALPNDGGSVLVLEIEQAFQCVDQTMGRAVLGLVPERFQRRVK